MSLFSYPGLTLLTDPWFTGGAGFAIAESIGFASSTAAVIGGAVGGAAGGATTAGINGGNIGKGALFGGLFGGFMAYAHVSAYGPSGAPFSGVANPNNAVSSSAAVAEGGVVISSAASWGGFAGALAGGFFAGGIMRTAGSDQDDVPPLVYRFGPVNNPTHARYFRDLFNPTRGDIQHLLSPSGHRQGLGPQWGVNGPVNNQTIAQMETALRVHVNDPTTQVIYGTSGPQRMTAIHFYNDVTGRVVTVNPITGGLRSPTGFIVSPAQADSLTRFNHLGTR